MTANRFQCIFLTVLISTCSAQAAAIYSNNFETPATALMGLTPGGTITSLTTTSLPTDAGGLGSVNQSTWLGDIGYEVNKVVGTPELVTLSLTGLTAGDTYNVAFDLLIGGSWDGSAGYDFGTQYGPDEWGLFASSGANNSTLVDATFSNCNPAICGAPSPQTYSIATPTAGLGGTTYAANTGAGVSVDNSGTYHNDYAIYYFGSSGGPTLTFTAGASTASLRFERISGTTDSPDEYWALDNIVVSDAQSLSGSASTPEPGTIFLFLAGLALTFLLRARRAVPCPIDRRR